MKMPQRRIRGNYQPRTYLSSVQDIENFRLNKALVNQPKPKFCVLIALNHLLVNRVSGGPQNQQNKSNKNTIVRPGATELIELLYNSEMFHIGFYSVMYEKNMKEIISLVVSTSKTKIPLNSPRITLFSGSSFSTQLTSVDYIINKDKKELIETINEDREIQAIREGVPAPARFELSDVIVIDYSIQNIKENQKIAILVKEYNIQDVNDCWMNALTMIFKDFIKLYGEKKIRNSVENEQNIVEFVNSYISIFQEVIS
jgi:hypothetical protein